MASSVQNSGRFGTGTRAEADVKSLPNQQRPGAFIVYLERRGRSTFQVYQKIVDYLVGLRIKRVQFCIGADATNATAAVAFISINNAMGVNNVYPVGPDANKRPDNHVPICIGPSVGGAKMIDSVPDLCVGDLQIGKMMEVYLDFQTPAGSSLTWAQVMGTNSLICLTLEHGKL